MSDADRRRRFLAFFEREFRGDRQALTLRSGYTKGRISQFFDARQPFGERAAANLAERLGLPTDFFERDSKDTVSAEAMQMAREYDALTTDEKRRFRLLLQAARA